MAELLKTKRAACPKDKLASEPARRRSTVFFMAASNVGEQEVDGKSPSPLSGSPGEAFILLFHSGLKMEWCDAGIVLLPDRPEALPPFFFYMT
ncbi:MAG: hypothetical protein JNM91_01750 [Flavobacteriales bacterium]|nr:hypothetical protein [Flavobacteriales bacterium]